MSDEDEEGWVDARLVTEECDGCRRLKAVVAQLQHEVAQLKESA